ncbi:MAG: putative hydrolase or acyltransferases (alpha/beta hydrolase superfamily) [uncultured archaeon A07HB70]|jgi:Predicted hydrolases or acyltransferases (alpha/beta hydrolase superfamily)|nr:MAG: putative hydrolase or acyltransferases (alpha/beta hydrolase superfamily) [uncultured archaeon A07HB70]
MRLRRLFATLTLLVAAGVAAVRGLRNSAGVLEPPLDGDHRRFRWRGVDVSYTEAGDPDDPTLVCLHGVNAAGSSGEFRAVVDDLATDHHVVAPDLPGYGCSDRPPLRYSARFYAEFVEAFVAEWDDPRVLASGLTAAYAVGAARDDPDLVADLTLVCPTAVAGPEPPKTALREALRAPVVGELLHAALVSRPSIRYFNADHGYYGPDQPSEEWVDYEWRTTHQPGARYATASFVSGYLNAEPDLADALASLRDAGVETTLVWGREATVTPLAEGRALAEQADCRLVVVDGAMLLPHVEFPGAVASVVRGGPLSVETAEERAA